MSKLRELKGRILRDGEDGCIGEADLTLIRQHLPPDGRVGPEDLKVLMELRSEARFVCPAFDDLFFPAFKAFLLADGTITQEEQFYLLRLLYGGGGIDETERRFLRELRREASDVTPEFEALYEQAMKD